MATWTKADIRRKIRQVTGRLSSNEITDIEIDDKINKFYQYTFPAEIKLERNHTYYEFLTTANQPYYTAPDDYINFEPPAVLDLTMIDWYQDPAVFQNLNNLTINRSTPWTGDGLTVNFTTTVAQNIIYPGTLVVTDNTETFTDTNKVWTSANVPLVGSLGGVGTVNYSTGVIVIGFLGAPANGQGIELSFVNFQTGKPLAVLYYNNEFQFFNVPDTAYRFRIKAYTKLSPLTLATDRPLLDQWGPCIAYGTARDLCIDYGEMDSYAEITSLYKEQVMYCLDRTSQSLLNTRAVPSF